MADDTPTTSNDKEQVTPAPVAETPATPAEGEAPATDELQTPAEKPKDCAGALDDRPFTDKSIGENLTDFAANQIAGRLIDAVAPGLGRLTPLIDIKGAAQKGVARAGVCAINTPEGTSAKDRAKIAGDAAIDTAKDHASSNNLVKDTQRTVKDAGTSFSKITNAKNPGMCGIKEGFKIVAGVTGNGIAALVITSITDATLGDPCAPKDKEAPKTASAEGKKPAAETTVAENAAQDPSPEEEKRPPAPPAPAAKVAAMTP